MIAADAAMPLVVGLIDEAGRLVEADQRLLDLNARAGGRIGAPIAVAPLAILVRLAQRLRIVVSRSVIAADGQDDISMWVRAAPAVDGSIVRLSITGWQRRPAWAPIASTDTNDAAFIAADAQWTWETDAALRLRHVTIDAGHRFGFDAAALLGRPLTALFALTEGAAGTLPILSALAVHAAFDDQPATIRASGRAVLLSGAVRTDPAGRFAGFAGAVRAAAPPVDDPAAPLTTAFGKQLDKALRRPLGRIIANADSIQAQSDGPLRQDYVGYAADIATAGRHLLALVDDLVDLQAVERDDFAVAVEPIDLADVARRAAGLLVVRAGAARVRIDKPGLDESMMASGDFRRALQVLVNLIGNAVRYSPPESVVWVRASSAGDHGVEKPMASIIVADQGKGVAAENHARIFEKFERVDNGEPGGSGLGLYIARRLARTMGGDVTIDSAPGQGARFSFTLPLLTG